MAHSSIRMTMDFISLSSKSCSRDNSRNLRNVFRSAADGDRKLFFFADGSSQESTCSSRHVQIFAPNNKDTEIDHDEYGIHAIERLSISRSSAEHNNTERVFFPESTSRDPEEYEDYSQTDGRSTNDCERTASSPTTSEIDIFCPSSKVSVDKDSGAREFFLSRSGGLKRANPIYESESEAEHVENNRHCMKRRRVIALGNHLSTTKPLFWAERLSSE